MNSWILVTDATNARFFEVLRHNGQPPKPLRLLQEVSHPQGRMREHELVTDDRGRSHNPVGKTKRSAMEPRTSPKMVEEAHFAREIARVLSDAREKEEFAAIAVVAPPKFAGVLRNAFDKQLGRRVIATIEKDYANLSEKDLSGRLSDTIQALRARSEDGSPRRAV